MARYNKMLGLQRRGAHPVWTSEISHMKRAEAAFGRANDAATCICKVRTGLVHAVVHPSPTTAGSMNESITGGRQTGNGERAYGGAAARAAESTWCRVWAFGFRV